MPGLHIGKLAPDAAVKDEVIKKDFIELRKTAEQMVCNDYGFSACLFLLQLAGLFCEVIALDLFLTRCNCVF